MGRLVSESEVNGNISNNIAYEYDDYSNRSQKTVSGEEDYVTTYNYSSNGHYTGLLQKESKKTGDVVRDTVYTYDANGNQLTKNDPDDGLQTNTYDGLNELIGVQNGEMTASYTYGYDGLRRTKTVNGETTTHVYDGQELMVDIGKSVYEADVYVRGTGLISSRAFYNGMTSDVTYYLQNAHGDVVNLTSETGDKTKTYQYDAFGVEKNIDDTDTNAFRYCGEYYDKETATIYLRARYYSPSTGRFISRDSFAGSNNDPLSLNLYTYCHNNPVSGTDSTGHFLDTFFDAASLAFDIVSFCIEPTPMGAVDILTDVVGLVTPGVPSAGLKVGVHAAETAYDAYKAVDTVHDLSKAADVAITVSKKGDAVLDAADAAKDIRNADYLQDSLNRIVKAQHPNPKKGFSNTYALTTSKDGRLVLSKNRGVPGPKARQEAENIFGKGKVEFAGGKNANLDLDLLKSKGISTKGIDFGRLHHAEPRAVQYMLKNNIPTDNAVQVVSRKSCDSCSNLQYNLGWKRRR